MGKEDTMSMCSEPVGEAEERIYVAVRIRPLNQRESSKNEISDWGCIDNTTVLFKSSLPDRSLYPTAYTFDRVFGTDSPTEEVYNEAAQEIALSVVSGINSSIFAYGQTSSGKTYTMSGITQCAMEDVFRYIDQHQEREFVLKFSAMEIYNEHVRDLLSSDTTPLRLLDDPEKGTVVERLTEETLEDWNHLQELLSICEAQRQIGETNLNEASSRSHQILRLTVESSTREYFANGNSSILTAQVNFVDLAGSERASQSLAAGVRLKEGSHINRSLLTLGTVIRKLSKGRNGHVPYRDSKLTRILQNSLGGNARTAIICTMSPARSHVEQSRNTLLFASCAKEVSTNAKVNLVMSDKTLVKQLQKELARLESQLSSIGSIPVNGDTAAALRKKDQLIEEMDKEIQELTRQRDLAQSRLESMLKPLEDDQSSKLDKYLASESSQVTSNLSVRNKSSDLDELNQSSPGKQIVQTTEGSEEDFLLDDSTPKFTGLDPCDGWEDIAQTKGSPSEASCKEVQCIESETSYLQNDMDADIQLPASSDENSSTPTSELHENSAESMENEDKESTQISQVNAIDALKQKIRELHETINRLEQHPALASDVSSTKGLKWCRSRSRNSVVMTIPSTLWSNEYLSENWKHEEGLHEKQEPFDQSPSDSIYGASMGSIPRIDSQDSIQSAGSEECMITKEIDVDIDDTSSVLDFVAGVNKISKLQSEKETAEFVVSEAYSNSKHGVSNSASEIGTDGGAAHWPLQFERYQRKIIDLWATCNVPLVHRSYFFLLFKGEPSDNVYMEVELRRLKFLRGSFSHGTDTNKGIASQIISSASSLKALNREREMLSRQILKKLTTKEKEDLYTRWGIKLDSKRRSLQLASQLWTDTSNMKHVRESAALVAKLVGFVESRHFPKEMFGLSLSTPSTTRKSSRWRDNMSSLL